MLKIPPFFYDFFKAELKDIRSRRVKHPIYGKYVVKTSKLTAHDETNQCDIGDKVRIMETRPISKNKRWRLTKLIEKVK